MKSDREDYHQQRAWKAFCTVTLEHRFPYCRVTLEESLAVHPAPQGCSYNLRALSYNGLWENPPAEPRPHVREEAPTTSKSQSGFFSAKAALNITADTQQDSIGQLPLLSARITQLITFYFSLIAGRSRPKDTALQGSTCCPHLLLLLRELPALQCRHSPHTGTPTAMATPPLSA